MKRKARQQVVARSYANRNPDYRLGLTKEDVAERVSRGDENSAAPSLTRSNLRIVRDNVLTLFNLMAVILTGLMVSIGEFKNALFIGVAISNTALGIFQEIRAKRIIDKLSIITQSEATVVREGVHTAIAPEEIVLDDILYLSAGSQICSDGIVVNGEGLEINESLLTGESDVILKPQGARVLSGSFVASGSGYVRVTNVGEENYANQISANSRYEKKPESELMRFLNRIIKVLTYIVIPLGALLFTIRYFNGSPYADAILGATASMVSMIPEGLMLLTGLSLAIGVLNLAKRKTLAQSVPSIETLARVDVLCLDKTGTITSGDLKVHTLIPIGHLTLEELETALSEAAPSMKEPSATNRAIRQRFNKTSQWKVTGETPFSSARKWSSVTFADQGTFVIGAPDIVCSHLPDENQHMLDTFVGQGYRVLLLAHTCNAIEERKLPNDLECLALIVLSDTIRQEAQETFAFFKEEGVAIKVISGDHPVTVSKVAAEAGIEGADQWVDMSSLPEQAITKDLVEQSVVFGRVSPYQKVALIRAMKESGKITAMTGDGVNDVMALREADCGVAMASGSDAARSAADFVLMDSNFASMVNVVQEGRRVVNNIEQVASLYLVKSIYAAILSVLFILLNIDYPFEPIQLTLIGYVIVGFPTFILTLKPNYERLSGPFTRKILQTSLPAALQIVLYIAAIKLISFLVPLSSSQSSTLCVLMTGAIMAYLLLKVSSPLDPRKKLLFLFVAAAFVCGFVFLKDLFSLVGIFNSLAIVYIPMLVLIVPVFRALSNLTYRANRTARRIQKVAN